MYGTLVRNLINRRILSTFLLVSLEKRLLLVGNFNQSGSSCIHGYITMRPMTKSSATLPFKRTIKVILIHLNMEATFIEKGCSNWKDALSNNRGFKLHESFNCHRVSVENVYALPRTTNDVADLLSKKRAAEKEIAQKPLLKILSNVRFLARQALPFRGHGIGEENSNFNQLYHLRAEDNEFLNEWAKRKGSSYMHHEI